MNVQAFLYNENLYRKIAIAVAIIRNTPQNLTPTEYASLLQNEYKHKRMKLENDMKQLKKTIYLHKQETCYTFDRPPTSVLAQLDSCVDFLRISLVLNSQLSVMSVDLQTTIMETIEYLFKHFRQTLFVNHDDGNDFSSSLNMYKILLSIIVEYDSVQNIRENCLKCIENFVRFTLNTLFKLETNNLIQQILIRTFLEQIGLSVPYFALIVEQVLSDLITYFDDVNRSTCYHAVVLIDVLETLIHKHCTVYFSITNNIIQTYFDRLLYHSMALPSSSDLTRSSLIVKIWNIYGRIVVTFP
ncbi:unnamed protein product [Didymodactylos carnosus]|uniref:Uncharacterized protein n=1 Tax=Didymodactylos carnosus TaxID=1234261 RepID=A0A814ML60_9BILA|nr:unnamed protein product [Didymodactylos carnosus]CAF1077918.1 unnamed protein product [Didymodactylos carnosus]CAF3663778.1 unnamed protein product [Didymodactylos carnosus]CAF3844201.1 unnamed protein product [Didymodactylos carnosus]